MNMLKSLADAQKTPFYLFDLDRLRARIGFIKKHLPENIKLCYAVKANPFIAEAVCSDVDKLELCSPGEFEICRRLKLPPEKFVISGVYKDRVLINRLVCQKHTPGLFTAESAAQLNLLSEAAASAKKRISVLLRLTSGGQFGMDGRLIENIIAGRQNYPWISFEGIQYFSGTQKTSLKKMQREINEADDFIKKLEYSYGFLTSTFEFGPGFPVAYFDSDTFDEESYLSAFSEMLVAMKFQGQITLELGRSIAASCGTYVTQIVDTKTNKGENYAIVDGGIHQLVYYGQSMAMKQPKMQFIRTETPDGQAAPDLEVQHWHICGSLCTINDILVKQLPLYEPRPGDLLAFENTGAYCMTEGIALFLSRDLPKIILFDRRSGPAVVREPIAADILNTPSIGGDIDGKINRNLRRYSAGH